MALAAEALAAGQDAAVEAGPVFAVGDFDSTELPEVRLLFAREEDAERYLDVSRDAGTGQQWRRTMTVHASYAACPSEARYLHAGTALSQLVRAR